MNPIRRLHIVMLLVLRGVLSCAQTNVCTMLTRFITSRIVLVLELISDVLGITLHHWPARGVNYSRAELHYISRPVGELINNSITSPLAPPLPPTIPGGLTPPRLPRRAGVSGRQGGIREVSGRQGRGLNCEIKKLFLEIQFSTKFTSWGVSGGRLYYASQSHVTALGPFA